MHHLAYIPSACFFFFEGLLQWLTCHQLPASFQEFVESFNPKWKSQKTQLLAHCRCELMHAVWKVILDNDFLHAYKYGMVIKCIDGIERRIYPRLFTYSADYPEKYISIHVSCITILILPWLGFFWQ